MEVCVNQEDSQLSKFALGRREKCWVTSCVQELKTKPGFKVPLVKHNLTFCLVKRVYKKHSEKSILYEYMNSVALLLCE